MNFKSHSIIRHMACLSALSLILACGGGGGTGGPGGGGANTLNFSYELTGFKGKLVNNVVKSATPQSVAVTVNGAPRTINNVIVTESLTSGIAINVLTEGSVLLDASIANAGTGAAISSTGLKAPISSTGTLRASILKRDGFILTVPGAVTWSGMNLPNGFQVSFGVGKEGDAHIRINAPLQFPESAGVLSGTGPVTYTAPDALFVELAFSSSDASHISFKRQFAPGGTDQTATADWETLRNSANPVFTTAVIATSL